MTIHRQSHLFSATLRTPPRGTESPSHRFLVQAGFVHQLASGLFSLLPAGLRVHRRIEEIIRDEMNRIGGQEILMPALQPKTLWEETGRWETIDPPLFITEDRHGRKLALGPTHEEVVTDLARTVIQSHKQLPVSVYQIQNKFRNEQRPTAGLLRVREFIMKDLYSFHASEEDLASYYETVKDAYVRVFQRCGLEVIPVRATSGSIGGDISHEFALVAETGEDKVVLCESCGFAANVEATENQQTCPDCGSLLTEKTCIENGHIFRLGIKYTEKMNANFTDADGTQKPIIMGCYGIGIGRLLAAIVESSHDDRGIIWPSSVSPYDVHVLSLNAKKEAEDVASRIASQGQTVLFDDREEMSAGEKFSDAELIGIPVQAIVSERSLKTEEVELRSRANLKESMNVSIHDDNAIVRAIEGLKTKGNS